MVCLGSEEGGWQVADTSPVPALPLPSLPVTPLLTWLEASTPLGPQSISQLHRALWVPALSLYSEQPSRWLPASGAELGSVPVPCCQPQPQGAACVGAAGLAGLQQAQGVLPGTDSSRSAKQSHQLANCPGARCWQLLVSCSHCRQACSCHRNSARDRTGPAVPAAGLCVN